MGGRGDTHVQITPTRLLLSSPNATTLMAYVQVEADDVRIYTISLVLLQRLIFVHSNGSRKGQKLSSSNVLLAVSFRDYFIDDVSFWTAFLGADTGAENGISNPTRSAGVGNTDRRKCYYYLHFKCLCVLNFASGYLSEGNTQRKGTGGFWTVEYYQPYFDIDTVTVRFQFYFLIIPKVFLLYSLGPTEMLHNTHPNLITHLPFHTSQSCRSLRAILDSHNAHFLPILVFVFGSLHCRISFNGRRAVWL